MIDFLCPKCGGRMSVINRLAGKTRTCPGCRADVPVPMASTIAPPEEGAAIAVTPPAVGADGPPRLPRIVPVEEDNSMPGWAWIFVALSGLAIIAVALGGAIPGAIGGLGAACAPGPLDRDPFTSW